MTDGTYSEDVMMVLCNQPQPEAFASDLVDDQSLVILSLLIRLH